MVNIKFQKKIAAQILKVGITKIWCDPNHLKEIREAITKADVRKLIKKGFIKTKSDFLAWKWKEKSGRKVRKGGKYSIISRKRRWILRIRPIRRFLKELKQEGKIDNQTFKELYKLAKGGMFRSTSHLKKYLEQRGIKV